MFYRRRLVTLAVQNALLTIIMHYSRVSIPASQAYSAASAVLLNELLKGLSSLTSKHIIDPSSEDVMLSRAPGLVVLLPHRLPHCLLWHFSEGQIKALR